MHKSRYTEKNGCLYIDFGQKPDGTAARDVTHSDADMRITAFSSKSS